MRREWPLTERLRFLSIYQKNLDEFFMVRIGRLMAREQRNPRETDGKTGWTSRQQIRQAVRLAARLQQLAADSLAALTGELRQNGIPFLCPEQLGKHEEVLLAGWFEKEVQPLLSPVVIDRRQPFPHIGNLKQAVVAELEGGWPRLGIVELSDLPAWEMVTLERRMLTPVARLVAHFAGRLFPGEAVRCALPIRLTRSAELPLPVSSGNDRREEMRRYLRQSGHLPAVRLQLDGRPSVRLRELLCRLFSLPREQVIVEPLPPDLSFGFDGDQLLRLPHPARHHTAVPVCSLRQLLLEDRLLCYPYDSMEIFLALLEEAAEDPAVASIRMTIYRLAAHSRVAAALCRAAANGKRVVCLVEWRARFDEQANLDYAAVLEEAGCTVIDGLPDYKVHAKLCLITLREGGVFRHITQIGTGNYNEKTATQYTDLCYLTADGGIGADAAAVFRALEAGELPRPAATLWIGPRGFRYELLALLEREIARGAQGLVVWKLNALGDPEVMAALVRASKAGVTVRLLVRGICCLRPGIPGLTDHITVRSIVGRYLEHTRLFQFGEGQRCRVFMGSGDLLRRNTERRVEAFAELKGDARERALALLRLCERDTENSWEMWPDGDYRPCRTEGSSADSQRPEGIFLPDR